MDASKPRARRPATTGNPAIAIAVLAAGRSTRMGALNKLLARFKGKPLVRLAAERALATGRRPVFLVTGHMAEAIEAAAAGLEVETIRNPAFDTGLSSSIKAAIQAVPDGSIGLLVHLADMPTITTDQLAAMIDCFLAMGGHGIAWATAQGRRRNPVIIPRSLFEAVLSLDGDTGARRVLEVSGLPIHEVELGPAANFDVDTPETLAAAGGRFD
ncbi:nucleotidyltransferase family protein [Mesorhizobium australicum]|uniref:Molybdenum cofactor cytidylyltransferase n=1 Tax=Mesorhizobium australicum TaxID=536018 RepID=A0A1X7MSI4_9HYPH|nr:nucleotidyltransferase family protein [Mesorhizobium australicum]SMH27780.1 molybdenum cofactor cytidylyltransferase [Mesorhizobium australicum]